jgi:putative membrane protein
LTNRAPQARLLPVARAAAALAGTFALLVAAPASAWAHGAGGPDENWNVWALTPDIVIPTILVVAVYVAGIARRGAPTTGERAWRHVAFLSGVAAVFLALESPVDGLADHLFWVHQIQHLLLRMIGPMLIALAAPQATLISGLPPGIRRTTLGPLLANRIMRGIFAPLTNPAVITALFIAALYLWELPRFHNAAILNDGIHYTMHITMLLAGLVFWWRVFDMRPAPVSTPYGTRLMMLWIVTLSNIALGAYTTLKTTLLYPAYDIVGRLFHVPPLVDESIGGFIIWVPGSMMCLVAIIIVVNLWGRHETRMDAVRERLMSAGGGAAYPTTGAALVEGARLKNQTLAIGFSVFAFVMFTAAILIAVLNHLDGMQTAGTLAHLPAAAGSTFR